MASSSRALAGTWASTHLGGVLSVARGSARALRAAPREGPSAALEERPLRYLGSRPPLRGAAWAACGQGHSAGAHFACRHQVGCGVGSASLSPRLGAPGGVAPPPRLVRSCLVAAPCQERPVEATPTPNHRRTPLAGPAHLPGSRVRARSGYTTPRVLISTQEPMFTASASWREAKPGSQRVSSLCPRPARGEGPLAAVPTPLKPMGPLFQDASPGTAA